MTVINSRRKFREQEVPVCVCDWSAVTYSSEHWETQQRTELIWLNMDRCFILILIVGTGTLFTGKITKIFMYIKNVWSFKILKPKRIYCYYFGHFYFVKHAVKCVSNIILTTLLSQIKNQLYICLLLTGLVAGDNIEPEVTDKISEERQTVKLSCSYSTSSQYVVLYWYRQYPNREPQYLLRKGARSHSDTHTSDGRFNSATTRTSTELTIRLLMYVCQIQLSIIVL